MSYNIFGYPTQSWTNHAYDFFIGDKAHLNPIYPALKKYFSGSKNRWPSKGKFMQKFRARRRPIKRKGFTKRNYFQSKGKRPVYRARNITRK